MQLISQFSFSLNYSGNFFFSQIMQLFAPQQFVKSLRCSITIFQEIDLYYRYLFLVLSTMANFNIKKDSVKSCESFRVKNTCQHGLQKPRKRRAWIDKTEVHAVLDSDIVSHIFTLSVLRNPVYLVFMPGEFTASPVSCTAWVVWEYCVFCVFLLLCVM